MTSISESLVAVWQKIVNTASTTLNTPCVMINRIASSHLEVFRSNTNSSHIFPAGSEFPLSGLYCAHVAKEMKMLKLNNAHDDPVWADSPTAKLGVIAYVGFPLLWPDGSVFGTLCTVDMKEQAWSDIHEDLLYTFKLSIEAHLEVIASKKELEEKNSRLQSALEEVKVLQGLLPICTSCKKIRDDNGYWKKLESYFGEKTSIEFSHGICPDCAGLLYPEYRLYKDIQPVV